MTLDDRQRLTMAGLPDHVDVDLVVMLVRRASPAPQRISAASDPDPSAPPDALAKALEPGRVVDPRRWARLRAVDRYALAHTYRRAVARSAFSILGEAYDAVMAASAAPITSAQLAPFYDPPARPSPPPPPAVPYQPAGYYSNVAGGQDSREPFYDGTAGGPRAHAGPQATPTSRASPAFEPLRAAPSFEPPARSAHEPSRLAYTPPSPPAQEFGTVTNAPVVHEHAAPLKPSHEAALRGFATSPPPASTLSNHLNQAGEVYMVDVARKPKTERRAVAHGSVVMRPDTFARLVNRDAPKGEVLATARVAAVMAAKRTHEVIPLCHMVALTHLEVNIDLDAQTSAVHVHAIADAYDRTGCDMEAMVAVSVACLTIYDMLKGIDRDMMVTDVKLMEKSGGRSGHYKRSDFKP